MRLMAGEIASDAEALGKRARLRYLNGDWEGASALIDEAALAGVEHPLLARLRTAMRGRDGGKKVFCVGWNKTGTTSLEAALRSLGYATGLQARGERLKADWARRDFSRIVALCRTADAFQDVPFSCDDTFRALDAHFPGSKFILTLRDNPEQWYESLVGFHSKIVGKGRVPTAQDLKAFVYRYPGYLWESARLIYGADESSVYDRRLYISCYLNHNRQVTEYFKDRPQDLLVLNVGQADAMEKLCAFLGRDYRGERMPHLNRSR